MELPQTPSFRLDGKRALVVGASSGIGLACATALAEAGANVTLAARRVDALNDICTEFLGRGWGASALALDVTKPDDCKAKLDARPAYDVVLNAAGLARHAALHSTSIQDFDDALAVNLRGAYFLFQIVSQRLVTLGRPGSLITISSQMGHVGGQDRTVYCAAKHGVEGMTKAMAIELGPHRIRVNTICPTFILTDLTRATFEDPKKRKWIEDKIKLGRVGQTEDIMGAAVYLASEASSLMTGSSLMIDGGWTAD